MGKVYLVGAGPGDAGLITVKGMEKLRECDAVVYDRLATEELLTCVRPDCERIYVGKQAGKHSKKQEEINKLLVECAGRYRMVVRLKGGDPFVFGRGGEEIEALEAAGISYEVVPGITSAVAVPECAGIPVTHRGVSRSFHVITGHTDRSVGSPDYDYANLAKLEGTLVFLMGLSNLEELADRLLQAGKEKDTPSAVISNGTTAGQQVVRGTLANISQKVREAQIPSPAVIVIGETAGCHYKKEAVCRIGITATKALQAKLVRGFEDLEMEAVSVCHMRLTKTEQLVLLQQEFGHLEEYSWVVFSSQNAVSLFFEELRKDGVDIRKLAGLRFAVLGSGTAEKLSEYGIHADFIPSGYTISVFAEEFVQQVKVGEKVLIPRAMQGSPVLTQVLESHQIPYRNLAIYDVKGELTDYAERLDELDYLVFVSASGVQAFFTLVQEMGISVPEDIKIVCIGEVTGKKLAEYGRQLDATASVSDVPGLIEEVERLWRLDK